MFRYKMMSFAISAAYAAIGGAIYAHYLGYLQPMMFQLTKSTELTIMVIFGGLGSIGGSVIGAFVLTFIPELFRTFAIWRLVVYGAGGHPDHGYKTAGSHGRYGVLPISSDGSRKR